MLTKLTFLGLFLNLLVMSYIGYQVVHPAMPVTQDTLRLDAYQTCVEERRDNYGYFGSYDLEICTQSAQELFHER